MELFLKKNSVIIAHLDLKSEMIFYALCETFAFFAVKFNAMFAKKTQRAQ